MNSGTLLGSQQVIFHCKEVYEAGGRVIDVMPRIDDVYSVRESVKNSVSRGKEPQGSCRNIFPWNQSEHSDT